jgi:poly-gamma-glutamate capsule biosynthesis protein CapA/YwtB (metallophosphatase superfamily)
MLNKYLKPIIVLLFALAILLGLSRREDIMFRQSQDNLQDTVTFLAVGDIMLSRDVARQMVRAKNPLPPFLGVQELLHSTDFNFGNLETPITESSLLPETNAFVFNLPQAYAYGLREYNFKILTLANNHAFDQGAGGASFTKSWLTKNDIQSVGTGATLDQAWEGQVVDINNTRIGFIGAAYGSGQPLGSGFLANIRNTEQLRSSLADLEKHSDFIVVAMHAGEEYEAGATMAQINFARAAIDAGADLVIGAHPHWVQPMEKYKGKYIFYSLGNFIFDQEWSEQTKQGLTLKITLEKSRLKQIELIPVIIENYCCPRLATEMEKNQILNQVGLKPRY